MRSIVALGMIAALATATVFAQPTFTTPTVTMSSLVYLGSPDLHKELKLDAEQIKKATALAQGAMRRVFDGRDDAEKRAALEKEIEKDLGFLKEDQRKRLREVILQKVGTARNAGRVLSADAAVVARLKLTAEQKTKLEGSDRLETVLTEAQQKEWKAMLGDPFAGRLMVGGFGASKEDRDKKASPFASKAALPVKVEVIQARDVAAELKLTDGQKEKIKELEKRWAKEAPSRAAKRKEAADLEEKLNREAEALLDDAQRKRLDQILTRAGLRGTREHEHLGSSAIHDKLALSAEHRTQIGNTLDARARELLALFTPEADAAGLKGKIEAFHADTAKRLEATLTKAQKDRYDDVLGKPFTGSLPTRLSIAWGARSGLTLPPVTVLDRGLRYLATPDLHKDAGLTAEQAKKLIAIAERGRGGDDGAAEKAMAAFLKAEQITRIKQILLQYFANRSESSGFGDSTTAPWRFVEVRAEVKLTDAQLRKLTGEVKFVDILDEAQKAKWKAQLGKPYEGARLSLASLNGAMAAAALGVARIRFYDEAGEVGLSEAQKKSLTEIEATYREESRLRIVPGGGFEEALKGRDAARAGRGRRRQAAHRAAAQAAGGTRPAGDAQRGLSALLAVAGVADKVGLNADQRKQIEAHERWSGDLTLLLVAELRGAGGPEADKVRQRLLDAARVRAEAVLSPFQQGQLKALLGKPYEGPPPPGRVAFGE